MSLNTSVIGLSKKTEPKKVNYKPLFARVLIQREVHKKIGNILLPENIQQRHAKLIGVVIAKGETASDNVQIGDTVMFGRHAGTWLDASYSITRLPNGQNTTTISDDDDGTLFLCTDEDILCVIEPKTEQ